MSKISKITAAFVLCAAMVITAMPAFAVETPYRVEIYDSGNDGNIIRENPDANSERVGALVDGNVVTVTQIQDGWGFINQGGAEGWIKLQYTKIYDTTAADKPSNGYITPVYFTVSGTGSEGLELRVSPTVNSSTYGPVPNGKVLVVQAISGDWAYTSYNGNNGWVNTAHLATEPFNGTVYDTGSDGLAFKSYADVNAERYEYIPEDTALTIDRVSTNGWGRTTYNGRTGWVSLRYTKVSGNYVAPSPSYGYITPTYYVVADKNAETATTAADTTVATEEFTGLELRTGSTIETSTFGQIPAGTVVLAEAIINDWAYVSYNGHKGWANTAYLAETSITAAVYDTDNEGLALKASADGSSQRYCYIPEETVLEISKVSNGWGFTSYNGQQGWVYVRYTRMISEAESVAPAYGFIAPKTYTVTVDETGLEMRVSHAGESISLCSIPNGTELTVTAIENNWGFTTYDGKTGWVLMEYLK